MAGFFPHTGLASPGYSSLPMATFDSLLSDIVADVGSGVNGWTLFDDQRTGSGEIVFAPGIFLGDIWQYSTIRLTNGSTAVGQQYDTGNLGFWAQPGLTPVSIDKTDWYTFASVSNRNSATLDRTYTGPTGDKRPYYTKLGGYVVLKCTSAQKSFYVKIARTMDYQSPVRIQVFETWNATTHTGTGGGPEELIRAYNDPWITRDGAQTKIQYILWLLPDVFALWAGADPNELARGGLLLWDIFYAGNLKADRLNDTGALLQVCSYTGLSGTRVANMPSMLRADTTTGGAYCLRNLSGALWWQTDLARTWARPLHCLYNVFPRGLFYLWRVNQSSLTDPSKFEYCELDAYHAGSQRPLSDGLDYRPGYDEGNQFRSNEGRRGSLRYLRVPISNPIGFHLTSIGVADDGNTYLCLRVSPPQPMTPTDFVADAGNIDGFSGFLSSARNGNHGDINNSNFGMCFLIRYFLLPMNV